MGKIFLLLSAVFSFGIFYVNFPVLVADNATSRVAASPSVGVAVGDSTVAAYMGGAALADLLFTAEEKAAGYACANIAVPGHTIKQQLAAWDAYAEKDTRNWIIVQIGLNDLDPSASANSAISRLQNFIDTINRTKKPGAKVIICTMIPCRQRLIVLYGATNGLVAQAKWEAINEAIKGKGPKPITGVNARIWQHTIDMADEQGNLKDEYDLGDHIHPNNAGRRTNVQSWRVGLQNLRIL